jgi:PEP-CTERM motif
MRRMIQISGVLTVITLLGVRPAAATPIVLTGLSDSGLTATVDNYSLTGNVFAFDLTNTSPGFILTGFGEATGGLTQVQLPFVLQTDVPTSLVPVNRFLFVHPPALVPNLAFPTIPTPDWALFITQNPNVLGLPATQTFHFEFTLSNDGGLSAVQLADGLDVRLRDDSSDSTPLVTDIVATFPHTATVPEPTSLALLGAGLAVRRLWRRGVNR